jgi:hypothetical protein
VIVVPAQASLVPVNFELVFLNVATQGRGPAWKRPGRGRWRRARRPARTIHEGPR